MCRTLECAFWRANALANLSSELAPSFASSLPWQGWLVVEKKLQGVCCKTIWPYICFKQMVDFCKLFFCNDSPSNFLSSCESSSESPKVFKTFETTITTTTHTATTTTNPITFLINALFEVPPAALDATIIVQLNTQNDYILRGNSFNTLKKSSVIIQKYVTAALKLRMTPTPIRISDSFERSWSLFCALSSSNNNYWRIKAFAGNVAIATHRVMKCSSSG